MILKLALPKAIRRATTPSVREAMIGGMVGNNRCGSNSVVYGSTREHLLEVKALLSDGSEAVFAAMCIEAFHAKCEGDSLENNIYKTVRSALSDCNNQTEIRKEFLNAGSKILKSTLFIKRIPVFKTSTSGAVRVIKTAKVKK